MGRTGFEACSLLLNNTQGDVDVAQGRSKIDVAEWARDELAG
jgi:hypothetical protein